MRESCKSYEGSERLLTITNRVNRTNKIGATAEQNRFSDRINKTNKATDQDKREKQSKSKQIGCDRP